MPRPKNPIKERKKTESRAMKELLKVINPMTLEKIVRASMYIPDHELGDGQSETSHFRFDVDVRQCLIQLAKLENDKARSESFVRDIEEVVNDYLLSRERSKRRPSPASQRAVLLEIRKYAARLQGLLARMDQDMEDIYCRSVPFPYENVLIDHRMTIEHIIHTTERAERRLSEDVRRGTRKNTDLENLFPYLRFRTEKYFPSLDRNTFGEFVRIACKGAKIQIPDSDDSPGRFWALVEPPFAPKPRRKP